MAKETVLLEDIKIEINGNIVGGAQSATVVMSQDNKVLHEGGNKKPREIADGQISYNGSVERLFLDVESIKDTIDMEDGNNPYFDLVAVTKNKNPERKVIVKDAKFKGFTLNLALATETKVTQEFDALDVDLQ